MGDSEQALLVVHDLDTHLLEIVRYQCLHLGRALEDSVDDIFA